MNQAIALPNTEWDKTDLDPSSKKITTNSVVMHTSSLVQIKSEPVENKQPESESKLPQEELKADEKRKFKHLNSGKRVGVSKIASSRNDEEMTLPLVGARLDIMSRIEGIKPIDYNARLVSLSNVVGLLAKHSKKYCLLLTELKSQKPPSTIINFKDSICDAVITVFRYHELQGMQGGDQHEEIDLKLFISAASSLRDLNVFNLEHREKIIAKYKAYCFKESKEVDEQFVKNFLEKRPEDSIESKPSPEKLALKAKASLQLVQKSNQLLPPPTLSTVKEESKKNESLFEGMKIKSTGFQPIDLTLTDREACVVCMANLRGVLYMPCRHFVACKNCSNIFQECPICTTKITNKINVFWS